LLSSDWEESFVVSAYVSIFVSVDDAKLLLFVCLFVLLAIRIKYILSDNVLG
jgi:hypothetical protein